MKPFYDQDVHFTASVSELQMLRVAVEKYADSLWENAETPEDVEVADKYEHLYRDITTIIESLPF